MEADFELVFQLYLLSLQQIYACMVRFMYKGASPNGAMYHFGSAPDSKIQTAKNQNIIFHFFTREKVVFSLFFIFAFGKSHETRKVETVVYHFGANQKNKYYEMYLL